jgi:uncharacterized membrane protein YkvA (DUF1232 family)
VRLTCTVRARGRLRFCTPLGFRYARIALAPLNHIAPARESSSTRIRPNGRAQRRRLAAVRRNTCFPQFLKDVRPASGHGLTQMSSMKLKEKLEEKSKELKSSLSILYYAIRDNRVGYLPKIIVIVCISYALSPIDLIPDFIPIIGYLDDLVIIPLLLGFAMRLIPKNVYDDAKEKSIKEPIKLNENWLIGLLIIGLWILVLYFVIKVFIKLIHQRNY